MKKILLLVFTVLFLSLTCSALAHQPRIVYTQLGDINVIDPEISQAFYDELKGQPRNYFIDSNKDFELYINLLVPEEANRDGKYSANIFLSKNGVDEKIFSIDGFSFEWKQYYEEFGRDYYLKGPEFTQNVLAGKYRIEIYSTDLFGKINNLGKYTLAVGQKESFDVKSLLNVYWQLPFLKLTFFNTSVLQFFLTPFGIGGIGFIGLLLILAALVYYLVGLVKQRVKHNQAKTLLLTSGGMPQMKDEIIKLLQKPAYDVTVAFITTAAKQSENIDYLQKDWDIMTNELGFNVEQVDIEGKKEFEVMKLLELKDIIYVEGGNTFYLMKAMRDCNFEKVIKNLLKSGKVYIGSSAGSIVAGRTIQTAGWGNGDKNFTKLKDLRGLNIVPFDIFVHYEPEWDEVIKKNIPNPKIRAKNLKIITDFQGILVQGKEVDLIGDGEAVVV